MAVFRRSRSTTLCGVGSSEWDGAGARRVQAGGDGAAAGRPRPAGNGGQGGWAAAIEKPPIAAMSIGDAGAAGEAAQRSGVALYLRLLLRGVQPDAQVCIVAVPRPARVVSGPAHPRNPGDCPLRHSRPKALRQHDDTYAA